jgi:Domain of unknown function (DUF4430)
VKLIRYDREGFAPRTMAIACLLLALALTSCGEDSGETSGPAVTQRVTRNFGNELLAEERAPLPKPATAMRALREHHDVGTAFQGDVVASIDGVRQDRYGEQTYWQWYVNDIETDPYPADFKLYSNDVVWWDLRYWHTTRFDTRATVGSFPAMFAHGFEGLNMPTRVLCEDDSSGPCRRVKAVLRKAGTQFGGGSDSDILHARVLVGKWDHWRDRPWPGDIDRGPIHSGVFARFARDEDALRVLDLKGHRVRSERGDVGLVAATRPTERDFMWYVTGLNDRGVELAARALDPDRLRRAYALVVTPDGDQKVPVADR